MNFPSTAHKEAALAGTLLYPLIGDGVFKFVNMYGMPEIILPEPKSLWAAGADLRAWGNHVVPAHGTVAVGTGLSVEMPTRFLAIEFTPRSGLALNEQITVGNAPGLIDPDYRGELMVILKNSANTDFHIVSGDRIAQMQIRLNLMQLCTFMFVKELSNTERGENGLGSSGVK